MVWSGSGIEKGLVDFIRSVVPDGRTVVEFGAGDVSTPILARHYKLFSFEDNILYTKNLAHHAPLIDGWYDTEIVRSSIPPNPDLILLDGPSGTGNRYGVLHNLELISNAKYIIVHDTSRIAEKTLAKCIGLLLKRKVKFMDNWAVIA
jgi:hypothetical protein